MVTDPTTLAVYAALAENVYRRDSVNDQALSVEEIDRLTGVTIQRRPAEANVTVTDPNGDPLVSWTDKCTGVRHVLLHYCGAPPHHMNTAVRPESPP